jgi:hypothetical protein
VQFFSGQLANSVARCTAGIALAEDVCKFADREPDRQTDPDSAHSSQTFWRKHPVSGRRSGGWRQKPSPLTALTGISLA